MAEHKDSFYIVFSTGTKAKYVFNNSYEFFLDRNFLIFFLSCIVLWLVMRGREEVPVNQESLSVLFYTTVIFFSLCILMVHAILFNIVRKLFKLVNVYTFIFLFSVVCSNEVMVRVVLIVVSMGTPIELAELAASITRNLLIWLTFEFIFASYVVPFHSQVTEVEQGAVSRFLRHHLHFSNLSGVENEDSRGRDGNRDGQEDELNRVEYLPVFDENIPINEIISIKAEDHYVSILLIDSSLMARARFSETIEGLPNHLGVQINRSVWVARDGIERCEKVSGGKVLIVTKRGDIYAVARARTKYVIEKVIEWRANLVVIR